MLVSTTVSSTRMWRPLDDLCSCAMGHHALTKLLDDVGLSSSVPPLMMERCDVGEPHQLKL
jgi:hypothetical protein